MFDGFLLKIDDDGFELFKSVFGVVGFLSELKEIVEISGQLFITGETLS